MTPNYNKMIAIMNCYKLLPPKRCENPSKRSYTHLEGDVREKQQTHQCRMIWIYPERCVYPKLWLQKFIHSTTLNLGT